MTYARPPGSNRNDFLAAREYEEVVGGWLGKYKIANLDSPVKMDYWVPGFYCDIKEKRQQLGDRFASRWEQVPREHLFVLDELSIRRALQYGYHAYFLIRDCPLDRVFLARVDEVACTERVRVDRETSPGRKKGKWLIDLRQFRQLDDPSEGLLRTVLEDQVNTPWKDSQCLSQLQIPTV